MLVIAAEFVLQCIDGLGHVGFGGKILSYVFRLFHLAHTFAPGPGPDARELSMDVTECCEALQGRINPAIQRHESGTKLIGIKFSGRLIKSAIIRSIEFLIMVGAINLAADQPSQRSSHNHIRWEMLTGRDPGNTDRRSHRISQNRSETPRILVRNY